MSMNELPPKHKDRAALIRACYETSSAKWLYQQPNWIKVGNYLGTSNNAVRKQYNRLEDWLKKRNYTVGDYADYVLSNKNVKIAGNQKVNNSLLVGHNSDLVLETDSNILIIGDTHFPFELLGYLEFCQRVQNQFQCDVVVHIGDLVDNHASSYHENDPDGLSARHEVEMALTSLDKWIRAFPRMYGLLGNHDRIPHRKAFSAGLPMNFLKSFEEAWNLPRSWQWFMSLEINGVTYVHGTGNSGKTPALNRAENYMSPVVSGHIHTAGGAYHKFGLRENIWGLNVGCGIDRNTYAMAYGKNHAKGFALGCGVVLQGNIPIFIPFM